MMEEVLDVKDMLERHISAPNHKNMPDTASHMCWLRALRQRIVKPMEKLRGTIPELLNNNDVSWEIFPTCVLCYSAACLSCGA